MTRQPARLGDLLPGVTAELAARHLATQGAPPMTESSDLESRRTELVATMRATVEPLLQRLEDGTYTDHDVDLALEIAKWMDERKQAGAA